MITTKTSNFDNNVSVYYYKVIQLKYRRDVSLYQKILDITESE